MVIYVIQKNGDNEHSPDSLNVMVNYHYHSKKNRNYLVIPIYASCLILLISLLAS